MSLLRPKRTVDEMGELVLSSEDCVAGLLCKSKEYLMAKRSIVEDFADLIIAVDV